MSKLAALPKIGLLALVVLQMIVAWWPQALAERVGLADYWQIGVRLLATVLLMAGALFLARRITIAEWVPPDPDRPSSEPWYLVISLIWLGLLLAVVRGEIDAARAVVVAILATGALMVAWMFWEDTRVDFRLERHWGNLGGPSGGFTLSLGMARLILLAVLLLTMAWVVSTAGRSEPSPATNNGVAGAASDSKAGISDPKEAGSRVGKEQEPSLSEGSSEQSPAGADPSSGGTDPSARGSTPDPPAGGGG